MQLSGSTLFGATTKNEQTDVNTGARGENLTLRLTYPMRGWAEVRWSETENVEPAVVDLLTTLAELPGVELEPDSIRVPRNVWTLQPWCDLVYVVQHKVSFEHVRLFSDHWEPKEPLYEHQVEAVRFLVAHKGGLCADEMGLGKQQRVDEPVLTPTGWRAIGDLVAGSLVVDPETGRGAPVSGVFPQGVKPLFRVTTADGGETIVGPEHQWLVTTPGRRHRGADFIIMSTQELLDGRLRTPPDKRGYTNRKWFLPLTAPVHYRAARDLPHPSLVHPYVLGVILGDGHLSGSVTITNGEDEIYKRVQQHHAVSARHADSLNYTVTDAIKHIRALELEGHRSWEKHVPYNYLVRDPEERLELLRGLMDTDGDCTTQGVAMFSTSSIHLMDAVVRLTRDLGGIASVSVRELTRYHYKGEDRYGRPSYRVNVRLPVNPFYLTRKAERWKLPILARAIESIEPVEPGEAVCIQVDSKCNTYITRDHIVTHNTRTAIVAAETLAEEDAPNRHRIVIGPKYTRAVWLRELLAVGAIEDESQFWAAETRDPSKMKVDWSCRWFFIHYDIVWWWSTYLSRGPAGPPIVSIIDALHTLKHGRVKRSKGSQALAGTAPNRIGLTGTPMPNRPSELWWPLTILDGKRSWGDPVSFRVRYCGATHTGMGYEDSGPTRVEELQQRLSNRYIRRTIEDSGVVLPKMTRQLLRVKLSDKQQTATEAITRGIGKDNIVRAVLERRAGKDTLAAITKLRKITSKAKLDTTISYVKDIVDNGGRVVVFTWQKRTVAAIADAIGDHYGLGWSDDDEVTTYRVTGDVSQQDRDWLVATFQGETGDAVGRENDPAVLVATLDSLKEGVTLTKARFIILHDLSWVPSDVLQAEARVHRIGQDKPVVSSWVVADDSIDMLLAATVTGKAGAMADALGITAARDAAEELGLEDFSVTSSVEAEMERLLDAWERS